jgi:hypothetical protein
MSHHPLTNTMARTKINVNLFSMFNIQLTIHIRSYFDVDFFLLSSVDFRLFSTCGLSDDENQSNKEMTCHENLPWKQPLNQQRLVIQRDNRQPNVDSFRV